VWRNVVHRRRADRELDEEIAAAFDLAVDEQIRRGVHPDRARRQAVLQFGRPMAIASEVRERRAGAALEILWKDVGFGGRLLVTIGGAIGVPAALLLSHTFASVLFDVTPADPRILAGSVLCLLTVAMLAAAVPAWRASKVEPLSAFRQGYRCRS
jgi:hypothetical protein